MSVILPRECEAAWLDGPDLELLRSYPLPELEA